MSRNLVNMPHIDKLNHVPKYPNKRTFVYQNRKRLFKILYLTLFALAKLKAFPVKSWPWKRRIASCDMLRLMYGKRFSS